MSSIYLLSSELCQICNVADGTYMHIKQIIPRIYDYILRNGLYVEFNNYWPEYYGTIFFKLDERLKKIITFSDTNERFTYENMPIYSMKCVDMYLELSGHITPKTNVELTTIIASETQLLSTMNRIIEKVEQVKSLITFDDDAQNGMNEVSRLLQELSDMYFNKTD